MILVARSMDCATDVQPQPDGESWRLSRQMTHVRYRPHSATPCPPQNGGHQQSLVDGLVYSKTLPALHS
jgi:hypothetical protein